MSEDNKERKDTKEIEEKALNYFKSFIEDSKVISQYLKENDREPCWDGHLYLYSEGERNKEHLLGRVPVQIKGAEVPRFKTKKWKYTLEKVDLKAYLTEPTFFIVCQIKQDSKERMLFHRELLPNLVKTLLRDMGDNDTRKTLFHPLTDNLTEFENQLKVFMSNSKRMVSFANSKLLTMAEAVEKGIKEFSFIAPSRCSDYRELLKYLSTHQTHLYAKVSKDLNIDMPLADGPAFFRFRRQDDGDVKIGDKVFFKGFTGEVKEGRIKITVSNVLEIDMPMDETDTVKPSVKMKLNAKELKLTIHEAEFAIALHNEGVLKLGDIELPLAVKEVAYIDELQTKLQRWRELDGVLDKMHVSKSFDLSTVSQGQSQLIDLLIETIGRGNTIKIPGQKTAVLIMEISNITLLIWCAAGSDGTCAFGDFFDKTIAFSYKKNENEAVNVSPYSYLQFDRLWERIDNIDYDGLIGSAQRAADEDPFCYDMIIQDVLAMISAADNVKDVDIERSEKLLEEAAKLNRWLSERDVVQERAAVHSINKLQIVKRQRPFTDDENNELESLNALEEIDDSMRFAILLLMDKAQDAKALFESFTDELQSNIKRYPIWRFYIDMV